MLNQLYIQSLQITFNKTYCTNLVKNLEKNGYCDANPFNGIINIGLYITDYTLRNVFVTVQTKMPTEKQSEYHLWIRPLSKEVYIATPPVTTNIETDPGFSKDLFRPIDEVYSFLNGGTGWYKELTVIDDIENWIIGTF